MKYRKINRKLYLVMVYIIAFLIVNKKVNNFIRDYNKCINIKKRKRTEL